MLQHEKYTRGVIDTGITLIREENRFDGRAGRKRDGVFVLMDLVAFDVLEGIEELGGAGAGDGAVADGEDVVVPGGAGYNWRGFGAVDTVRGTVEGVDADIVFGCCDDDEGGAEGYGGYVFAGWEAGAPVCSRSPGLVRAVEYHGWILGTWGTGEESAIFVEAGFVVLVCVGEVEVAVEFSVVELYGHGVMGVLIHCPDEADEVYA